MHVVTFEILITLETIANIFPFYIPFLAAFQLHRIPNLPSHKFEQFRGADHI